MASIDELNLGKTISLNEAGMSRVLKHADGPFVMLTGYRSENNARANQENNARLISMYNAYGFGGIQVVGHWVEELKDAEGEPTGEKRKVVEHSFFIPYKGRGTENLSKQEFFYLTQRIGREFKQEAVLVSDGDAVFAVDCFTSEMVEIGKSITTDPKKIGDMYSIVKGTKFVFESFYVGRSLIESRIMKRAGILL